MKASGFSVYFNCEDSSYSGRDNQATIEKLKDNVVDFADESNYMYSMFSAALHIISLLEHYNL